MVNLIINGKSVKAEQGQTILDAAKTLGIEIPTFCHSEGLAPYGACRICTVEVEKGGVTRLQASCAYPVEEGITVRTNTDRVIKGRKLMIEFLLARCPNVKKIQDLAKEYGIEKVRFTPKKEDCILCGMCVRVCVERLGVGAIGFTGRGVERKVGIPFGEEESSECLACGACTYVCPTGAIQMEAKTTAQRLRLLPSEFKYCRYMMMGALDYKICPNNYYCYRCEVDQRMEEMFNLHPALAIKKVTPKTPIQVNEFVFLPDRLYYKGHIWMQKLNGKLKVGIDDFARRLVGEIDDIKTSSKNTELKKGDTLLEIVVGRRSARMLSPVSGRIVDINSDIVSNPRIVARDPYIRWIYTFEPKDECELKELYSGSRTRNWLKSDAERLRSRMEKEVGVIVTDGGEIAPALNNKLSDAEWEGFIKDFFLV